MSLLSSLFSTYRCYGLPSDTEFQSFRLADDWRFSSEEEEVFDWMNKALEQWAEYNTQPHEGTEESGAKIRGTTRQNHASQLSD